MALTHPLDLVRSHDDDRADAATLAKMHAAMALHRKALGLGEPLSPLNPGWNPLSSRNLQPHESGFDRLRARLSGWRSKVRPSQAARDATGLPSDAAYETTWPNLIEAYNRILFGTGLGADVGKATGRRFMDLFGAADASLFAQGATGFIVARSIRLGVEPSYARLLGWFTLDGVVACKALASALEEAETFRYPPSVRSALAFAAHMWEKERVMNLFLIPVARYAERREHVIGGHAIARLLAAENRGVPSTATVPPRDPEGADAFRNIFTISENGPPESLEQPSRVDSTATVPVEPDAL